MKYQELTTFANELKALGYSVIIPQNEDYTWFHVFKNGKMAYVEYSPHRGWNFSSVHVPCRDFGSGLSIHREMAQPNVQYVENALAQLNWGYSIVSQPKHYKNEQEFIKDHAWEKPSLL